MVKPFLILVALLLLVTGAITTVYLISKPFPKDFVSPLTKLSDRPKPLNDYTFEALSAKSFSPSHIDLVGIIDRTDDFTAYQFAIAVEDRRVTGQINLPHDYDSKHSPVVVMMRGFVDPEIYQTGIGTKNAAAVFAANGYITAAPDFLGYGESDPPDIDTYAARVKKPVTVLTLIESLKHQDYIDPANIYLWGHSNGGQIALSVLEITGQPYPTTLWAPVSKPFPYSILYYTDEYDDFGKALRKTLADFEADYDVDLFSIHKYYDHVTAPIQIHQGASDDAVPLQWSNDLADTLEALETQDGKPKLEVDYYTYPSADHNLQPNWNTVVSRDLAFFARHTNQEVAEPSSEASSSADPTSASN